MARRKGTLSLSSNLNVLAAAPLDARELVETTADMIDPNSWDYTFVGMKCYNKETQKWYTLRYDDPTNISSWAEMTQGADGKDGLNVSIDSVSKQGRENTVTFVWKDPDGSDKSIDLVVLDGQKGDSIVGPPGPQGEPGESFSIRSQYATEEELRKHHPTGNSGDAYFVGGNETTPHLFFWNEELNDWDDLGEIIGTQGPKGDPGEDGFSPDITVAETADNSYKLRITTANGSFVTPNLQGNLAPIDRIDTSANPVQSGAIKTALDAKQDKTLATAVGVRDYTDGVIKNQTTVQTTLEALAASVNYSEVPVQLGNRVDTKEQLPTQNVKPGTIYYVGLVTDEVKTSYIYQEDGTWSKLGGGSDDVMVEMSSNRIDEIWDSAPGEILWMSGTTLLQDFCNFGACIYDDKINILGGHDFSDYATGTHTKMKNDRKYHYQLNNGRWESVSTLPSGFSKYPCVAYDNKIYLIMGTAMRVWDGNEWTTMPSNTLPYSPRYGCAVVFNNEIHLLGGKDTSKVLPERYHYKYDGSEWTEVSTLPFNFYEGSAIVYDNKIHIIGSADSKYTSTSKHYAWDGTSWAKQSEENFARDTLAFIYNDKLNIIKQAKNYPRYEFNDGAWTKKEDSFFCNSTGAEAIVLNGHVHLLGGDDNNTGDSRAHRILQ